jgi:hypothetical protein
LSSPSVATPARPACSLPTRIKHTGDRVTYHTSSGPPDSLDRLVAKNFATLAADLILAGKTGCLAIQTGRDTTEPVGLVAEGKKRVDVESSDPERCRPSIVGVMGSPMLLC